MIKLLEDLFEELPYLWVYLRDHIIAGYQMYLNRRNFVKSFANLSIWCQDIKTIANGSDNKLHSLFVISYVMKIERKIREFNEHGRKLSYRLVYDIVDSVNYIKSQLPKL